MIAVEKAADASGLSYQAMMENAGLELAKSIIAHSHGIEKSVFALVGKGNNGGDALLACAYLAATGWKVGVLLQAGREDDQYVEKVRMNGGTVYRSKTKDESSQLAELVEQHAILLDGLLGTGVKLPLQNEAARLLSQAKGALAQLNNPPMVIAVDCPSGLDCDSGEIAAETIRADLTVCMAALKRGMLTVTAWDSLGEIDVVDIGLPEDMPEWTAIKRFVLDKDWVLPQLPERPLDAHKGTFGTALIIAGSKQFPGAALLAGQAAARSGAGLISMAVPESIQETIVAKLPEAIWIPLTHSEDWITDQDIGAISKQAENADTVLMGPGFGLEEDTAGFIGKFLALNNASPLVIDADGLKLLSGLDTWPNKLPKESVLTPHPGEMAVLTDLSKEKIQADRLETAERFAVEWNQNVLLKGAFTIIASPDGRTAILPVSTSALATAGTGDVLAGLITGLLAQGLKPFEAACVGAWLHAMAGLNAATRIGSDAGVIATDLLVEFPKLLNR
jgi:NAD(P)H-hydrate epimerase